jgi:hypothetical protein
MEQSYHYRADRPLSDNHDALEAYRIFRWARNWLFIIIFLCLILVQGAFWIVDRGGLEQVVENRLISFQPLQSAGEQSADEQSGEVLGDLVRIILKLCNAILVFTLVLYFLVQIIAMNIAVVGRLGGLASSSKAIFLSLIMVVLILPWDSWYGGANSSVLFSYADLMKTQLQLDAESPALGGRMVGYYFRFVGMWLIMLALLFLAQVFSGKAWKQALHRSRAQGQIQPVSSPMAAPSPPQASIPLEQMPDGRDPT